MVTLQKCNKVQNTIVQEFATCSLLCAWKNFGFILTAELNQNLEVDIFSWIKWRLLQRQIVLYTTLTLHLIALNVLLYLSHFYPYWHRDWISHSGYESHAVFVHFHVEYKLLKAKIKQNDRKTIIFFWHMKHVKHILILIYSRWFVKFAPCFCLIFFFNYQPRSLENTFSISGIKHLS